MLSWAKQKALRYEKTLTAFRWFEVGYYDGTAAMTIADDFLPYPQAIHIPRPSLRTKPAAVVGTPSNGLQCRCILLHPILRT